MMNHTEQVNALLSQAYGMPMSSATLALLEEAVRIADLHNDIDLGIDARQFLMQVARQLLRGDLLTTAFVWTLAQYDRDPRRFTGRNLFTEYRWVIGQLANQDGIARATLEEMLADYGRRLESAGYSKRNWHFAQQQIAPDLGDQELAIAATKAMRDHPRDAHCADPGWELAEEVQTENFLGHPDQALLLATPFLQDRYHERGKSDEICAGLLLPLLKRGRTPEAIALQTRCLRSFHPERVYYWWFGDLLKFSALTNDLGRAVKWYGQCQSAIHEFTDPLSRLHFGLDAIVVMDRLLALGKAEITVRMPKSVPVAPDEGRYSVAGLRSWLGKETTDLAQRFDARNGNSYFQGQLRERAELQACALE